MSTQTAPVIAGKSAGKRIRCATEYQPALNQLQAAARRGSHWPRIAIRELEALSSGLLGKRNVYLRPGGKNPDGNPQYFVFLPGLLATLVRWPNDEYCITRLELDAKYFEATSDEKSRLGLYRATPDRDSWSVRYSADGSVLNTKGRVVSVADSGYDRAVDAARDVMPRVVNAPGVPTATIRQEGCDLHFTPGPKRLGGVIRYNAISDNRRRGSAVLLAETMANARGVKNVVWVADKGGSSVLTQAMQILVDKGVTLHGHSVFMYKPKSSPGDAVRLAHRLELVMNENFADTGWGAIGALSQLRVSRDRLNNDDDPYNKHYHDQAWINALMKAAVPGGIISIGLAASGASIPLLASVVTAVSGGGGAYLIGKGLAEDIRHRVKR